MNRLSFHTLAKRRILAINGSHRQGNTQFALSTIIKAINDSTPNHQGLLLNLRQHNIDYCNQHEYNSTTFQHQNDDMPNISQLLQLSDIIIFGSPIYFYSVTGRMKTFIDRCNGYRESGRLKDKVVFTVGVGGSTQPDEMIKSLNGFYAAMGFKDAGYEFFTAEGPMDLQMKSQVVKRLEEVGRQVVDTKF